jgi:hypothetical protein
MLFPVYAYISYMEFFDACRSKYMHVSPPLAWYAFCHHLLIALVYNQADGTRVFFYPPVVSISRS